MLRPLATRTRARALRLARTPALARHASQSRRAKKRRRADEAAGAVPPPPPLMPKFAARPAKPSKKALREQEEAERAEAEARERNREEGIDWRHLVTVVRFSEGLSDPEQPVYKEAPSTNNNVLNDEELGTDADIEAAWHASIEGVTQLEPCEKGVWTWTLPGFGEPYRPSNNTTADARKLFREGFKYLGSGRRAEHMSRHNQNAPEIAVLGRSNVGKSSFMNAMLGVRKSSDEGALVSNKQGRTRQVHAWGLGARAVGSKNPLLPDYRLVLTDLPGYGYAALNKQGLKDLTNVIFDYLTERDRQQLTHAVVLIDSRVGLTDNDKNMMQMLETIELSYTCVLTKCDRVTDDELEKAAYDASVYLRGPCNHAFPRILGFSAKPKLTKSSRYVGMSTSGNLDRLRSELLMFADNKVLSRRV